MCWVMAPTYTGPVSRFSSPRHTQPGCQHHRRDGPWGELARNRANMCNLVTYMLILDFVVIRSSVALLHILIPFLYLVWVVKFNCIPIEHKTFLYWECSEIWFIFPICCCGFNIDIVTFGNQAPQWDPNNYRNSILGRRGPSPGLPAIGHLISIMGTWLGDLATNNVTNTSIKTTNISLNTALDSF